MTKEASNTVQPAKTIIIAQDVPEEVQDSGQVRMGGAIKVCWLTLEIFHYLPGLMRYWPNGSC
jgi:hypothetical protein